MEKLWKTRHTTGKRLLYVMMSLCMIMLQFPITASASTKYDLWVGGVRVTDDNAGNITGDNISGTVSYDNDTNTLTLNNATITSVVDGKGSLEEESHGIYAGPDFDTLTIVLEGNNTITGGNGKRSFGISIDGSGLIFSGNGSLQVSADSGAPDEEETWSVAVFSFGKIVINSGCTMEASCGTASYVAAPFYSATEGLVELNGTKIVAATDKNGNPVSNPKDLLLNIKEYSYMKFEPDTGDMYSISLDCEMIHFAVDAGYNDLLPRVVTVTNTGTETTGELTVELSGNENLADKFELSAYSLPSLAPGESTSFSVVLKEGCEAGIYPDVIMSVKGANGISASAKLRYISYPEKPVITGTLTDAVYTKGEAAATLEVSATVADGGTLSYQWAIDNGATSDIIKGATNPTFTPPTDTVGTTIYYCLVTNTKNGVSMEKFSESVTITVKEGGSDAGNTGNSGNTGNTGSTGNSGNTGNTGNTGNSGTSEVTYQIMEGAESSLTVGSNEVCVIRGNGEFSKFTGVKVDGYLLDQSNYTAREGSTIITLQASYLNMLASGTHTVEILWTDGSASTTFTINENTFTGSALPSDTAKKDDVPKTGESTPIVWLFLLAGFSGMGLLLTRQKGR